MLSCSIIKKTLLIVIAFIDNNLAFFKDKVIRK